MRRARLCPRPASDGRVLPLLLLATLPLDTPPPARLAAVSMGQLTRGDTAQGPLYVWSPSTAPRRVVIYLHGYGHDVDRAVAEHALLAQLAQADATVLIPEAPHGPRVAVAWPTLEPLLLAAEGVLARPLARDGVVVIGHSGAYRTIRGWLGHPALTRLVLLDALYGDTTPFSAWARADPHHHLHLVSRHTAPSAAELLRRLDAPTRTRVTHERSDDSHMGIVTHGQVIPRVLARALAE